ncbi:paired box protein Pax-2a [Caerostris extrusa]|uniref:Paired box protein Pax-2a n=1 Tax=Caerostris extrusa TaxID=172846 RepID=A0AAV4TLS1_CAEEX|nr:paired box protein Pax-2a [Caerostris extrusa]
MKRNPWLVRSTSHAHNPQDFRFQRGVGCVGTERLPTGEKLLSMPGEKKVPDSFSFSVGNDSRDLNGDLHDDESKRQRTQYNGDQLYTTQMWPKWPKQDELKAGAMVPDLTAAAVGRRGPLHPAAVPHHPRAGLHARRHHLHQQRARQVGDRTLRRCHVGHDLSGAVLRSLLTTSRVGKSVKISLVYQNNQLG